MDWRARWALMETTMLHGRFVRYRFMCLDGTERTIVVNDRTTTIADACAMLDEIEAHRAHVDRALLD